MATQVESASVAPKILLNGPQVGVQYPNKVLYCGGLSFLLLFILFASIIFYLNHPSECSMPFEYCEYYTNSSKCKEWLEKNLPDMFAKLYTSNGKSEILPTMLVQHCVFYRLIFCFQFLLSESENQNEAGDGDDEQSKKGRQKRGGKALLKPKKKESGERLVKLARANRGKKKYVTGLMATLHL